MVDLHRDEARQEPGSDGETLRALDLTLPPATPFRLQSSSYQETQE